MKLFCFLATLVLVSADDPGYDGHYYSIEDIRELADALEYTLIDLNAGISDATTAIARGQERIQDLQDFFLPGIALVNSQQSSLADQLAPQIKALQHGVDEALALAAATSSIAQATESTLAIQNELLNETEIAPVNEAQADLITNLTLEIAEVNADFLDNLNSTLEGLENNRTAVAGEVDVLADLVDGKRCVTGYGALTPETDTHVYFLDVFASPPDVNVAVTGFETDLDVHSYDKYDGISLTKSVSNVTVEGFTINAMDISEGMVEFTRVYYSYMACVGL
ncbi:uncharacterized protein [Littorina saxatilis]|uniref:Uncharacterized protein n=1 Tax=Littorina saxatilis TaxID=31220 RepID=A0AAN9AR60_9CAEN